MRRLALGAASFAAVLVALLVPLAPARAAFEGTDGLIAFERGGVLYTAAADGSHAAPVTGSPAGHNPSWNGEGSALAYDDGSNVHVATWDPASSEWSVSPKSFAGTDPAYAPDGTKVAFVRSGDIFVASPTGGDATNLTNSGDAAGPAWSPDGARIVFSRASGSVSSIWRMSAVDGSSQTQLTAPVASVNDIRPTWSPDGTTIAFESNRVGGHEQVFSITSSGASLTRVTNTTSDDGEPVYSPSGTRLLVVRGGSIEATDGSISAPIAGAAPDEQPLIEPGVPSISGIEASSSLLTVDPVPSTWTGVNVTFTAYQWQRCDSSGSSCSDIASATTTSYTLTPADVEHTIRVVVTATNGSGVPVTATSDPTDPIQLNPGPVNVVPPAITLPFGFAAPQLGLFLTVSTGTWTGQAAITSYKYQWEKCDLKTTFCYTIAGATSPFFTPTDDLVGWGLDVRVTATNALGSTEARTPMTAAVTADPPLNRISPRITGDIFVASTLEVDDGVWDGHFPIAFSYQWKRCNPPGDLVSCVAIPGATSNTYVLQPADEGLTIRAFVTAKNAVAIVTVFSIHTFPIRPERHFGPSSTAPPDITGTFRPGFLLRTTVGLWSGDNPIAFSYQWERCDATGESCAPIPNAIRNRYSVSRLDLGFTVRARVTATNAYGTAYAESDPGDAVSLAPEAPKGRRIVGTPEADYLAGGGGNDVIQGLGGNDTIRGGAGGDRLDGGPGNDIIDGGPNADRIDGGPGSDTILAADGFKDTIDCGPGNDRVIADMIDVLTGCEAVTYAVSSTQPGNAAVPGGTAGPTSPTEPTNPFLPGLPTRYERLR
jgi:hypothetical protein